MAWVFAICFRASTSASMFNQKKIYDFLSFSTHFTEYFGPDFMRILWFVEQIDESLWAHIYRHTTINLIQLREIVKTRWEIQSETFHWRHSQHQMQDSNNEAAATKRMTIDEENGPPTSDTIHWLLPRKFYMTQRNRVQCTIWWEREHRLAAIG